MKIIRRVASPFNHIEIREVDDNGTPTNHYVIAPGDDYASEPQEIKAICSQLHTPVIISAHRTRITKQKLDF